MDTRRRFARRRPDPGRRGRRHADRVGRACPDRAAGAACLADRPQLDPPEPRTGAGPVAGTAGVSGDAGGKKARRKGGGGGAAVGRWGAGLASRGGGGKKSQEGGGGGGVRTR